MNGVLAIALSCALACLGGCRVEPAPVEAKVALLPQLADRQDDLHLLQLRGAGGATQVTLVRKAGQWRVGERGDWPADPARVSQYLFLLSQAHRQQGKTSDPAMYSRIGVEPITSTSAKGHELSLAGKGISHRLLIGDEHARFDSHYVRVDGEAKAWLTDLPVGFDPDPASWLDLRLVDFPLARVARVQVGGTGLAPFALSHRDDRFRLESAPSAAMRDSYQGDALAGALAQLKFEDVAVDPGTASAERELVFTMVDGLRLSMDAWRIEGQPWVRIDADVDEAVRDAWAMQTSAKSGDAASARDQAAALQQRLHGRRFRLPPAIATQLWLTQDDILAGAPAP